MKKEKKIIAFIVVILMFVPFTVVNAGAKIETIVESLQELAETFDGNVNYEDDTVEIEWYTPNSESDSISFSYNGNIIEYNSGEITSYDEAKDTSNHIMYGLYLIKAALRVNGYTDQQIQQFFTSSTSGFDYEINGIEYKQIGETKPFTNEDETITTYVAPISIKIDVTRANLNTSSGFEATSATIDDIVEELQSNSDFTTTEYEGRVYLENEISNDDDSITIYYTSYDYDYNNVLFTVEDNILVYEDEELEDYYAAQRAASHQFFASQMLMYALKENGYTTEQIQKFFADENSEFDYETNGFEIKKLGEEKTYTNEDETITVSPMLIKIDFSKANLNKKTEEEIKGEYKLLNLINNNNELTFRFNIEYSKFKESGKVYIDGNLVDSNNYTSKEGSTIITFNNDYVKSLANKEHTLKVTVVDGEVETTFAISNNQETKTTTSNPKTYDFLMSYVSMLGLSIIGLIGTGVHLIKSKLFN